MPCPHNEITIVQRSQRQSAVAVAAYQSGEKLCFGFFVPLHKPIVPGSVFFLVLCHL